MDSRTTFRLLAFAIAACALAACDRIGTRHDTAHLSAAASPSAQLIGTTPAGPTPEPAGVTPVTANTTDIGKGQAALGGPREGDVNSFSTLDPKSPQKGDQKPDAANSRGSGR